MARLLPTQLGREAKIISLLSLFILVCLFSSLLGISVDSRIVNPHGNPVDGALIASGTNSAHSADDGSFSIEAADSLVISHPDYQTLVVPTLDFPSRVVLIPEPVHFSPRQVWSRTDNTLSSAPELVFTPLAEGRRYSSAREMLANPASSYGLGHALRDEVSALITLNELSRYTLIYLNGLPMNPQGDPFDLGLIDPATIQSINVIKHDACAPNETFGTGGIIEISTRAKESSSNFFSQTETGSFGYAMQHLSLAVSQPRSNYRMGISGLRVLNEYALSSDEQEIADGDTLRLNNRKADFKLSGAMQHTLGHFSFALAGDLSQFRRQLPGPLESESDYREAFLKGNTFHPRFNLRMNYGGFSGQTTMWLTGSKSTYDNTLAAISDKYAKFRQQDMHYGIKQELTLRNRFMAITMDAAQIERDFRYEDLLSASDPGIDTLSTRYSFGGVVQAKISPLSFLQIIPSFSERIDKIGEDLHYSHRGELVLRNPGTAFLELGGSYGNSLSIPEPLGLLWKGDAPTLGSPYLPLGNTESWQAWGKLKSSLFSAQATLHHALVSNFPQWQPHDAYSSWEQVVINRAELRNLELNAWLAPVRFIEINASALLVDARDISTAAYSSAPELLYQPDKSYGLSMSLKPGAFSLWGKYNYTGRQHISSSGTEAVLAAYQTWDAGVSYSRFTDGWEITPYFTVSNLLDSDYQMVWGVPEPGRGFFGGIILRQND